jgi:hypothetical protein
MDKTTFFNLALSLLGGGEYHSEAATSSPCDLWYPVVLREAACRHNWSFSRRSASLPLQPDGSYHLPDDCMNILYLRDAAGNKPASYLVEGRSIIGADLGTTATLIYTSDTVASLQELPDSAPEFCVGAAYLLAARIARTITGDTREVDLCLREADRQFTLAITRDAQQEKSNKLEAPYLPTKRRPNYA